jgi:hypothetical protein
MASLPIDEVCGSTVLGCRVGNETAGIVIQIVLANQPRNDDVGNLEDSSCVLRVIKGSMQPVFGSPRGNSA